MKILCLTALITLFALGAMAQDTPIWEVATQYQLLRVNSTSFVPAFSANGGTGSFQINFFDQLAGVLEVGAEHNGNIHNVQLSNTWMTYLVGPRVSLRNRNKKFIPALEALFGGTTLFANVGNPVSANGSRLSLDTTGFGMALGGTLDLRMSHLINLRLMRIDYLMTRVHNAQNNFRYGAGIDFTWGAQ